MHDYKTLRAEGCAEFTEKKSHFIAYAAPAIDEAEALAFVEKIKNSRRDADHNVYAYRVGVGTVREKYFDDGEPSGTAGLPALSVLKKEDLTNAVVVVTRYFGGIPLGAGGLVRAYGAAAKAGVAAAGIAVMRSTRVFSVNAPYAFVGKLQREADAAGYIIVAAEYAERAEFTMRALEENFDDVAARIKDMTDGAAEVAELWLMYSC